MTDRQTDRQTLACNSIDLLKFIFAFFVVAIHTNPLKNCTNIALSNIYMNVVSLAVPFFFLASGYLLSSKMNIPFTENDINRIKVQLKKLVKMYLMWMIIYTPLAVYHNICQGTSFVNFCLIYVRNFIFIGEQYNSWPLWYLLSSIYSLLFIMLLVKIQITPRGMLLVCLAFIIISVGIDWFMTTKQLVPCCLYYLQKAIHYTFVTGRIFSGMIYITLGMIIAHNKLSLKTNILIFILAFASRCYLENFMLKPLLLIFAAVGLFGIVEKIKLKNNNIYPILRFFSTVIYLIHMYIWSFYYTVIYNEKTYGWDSFLITSIISLALAIFYFYFFSKNKGDFNSLRMSYGFRHYSR